MSVFELDTQGAKAVEQDAMAHGIDVDAQAPPGFFEGVGSGIGQGIMRGGARAGQFLSMAAAAPAVLFDKSFGTDYADSVFKFTDDHINSAVDYWTPDANTVGTAGRVLGGLSEIALPLMAGAGNPSLMIGSQEMGTATDLVRQGADAGPATAVGIAQGLSTAIGFKLPFLGSTFLTKAATGAAGNLVTNTATAALSREILGKETEYGQQFNPWDAEARLTDLLTGIAFGGLAHLADRSPSVRDAAAAAANAKHFQEDTAPGIPIDPRSTVVHQDAMEAATKSLLAGEPVAVSPDAAEFLKRPDAEIAPEVQAEVESYETKGKEPKPEKIEFVPPDEPIPPRPEGEQVDPIVAGAHEIEADHMIPIEDENGNVSTISSKTLLAKSAEAVKQAENDSKGFLAAANCFLRVGQ